MEGTVCLTRGNLLCNISPAVDHYFVLQNMQKKNWTSVQMYWRRLSVSLISDSISGKLSLHLKQTKIRQGWLLTRSQITPSIYQCYSHVIVISFQCSYIYVPNFPEIKAKLTKIKTLANTFTFEEHFTPPQKCPIIANFSPHLLLGATGSSRNGVFLCRGRLLQLNDVNLLRDMNLSPFSSQADRLTTKIIALDCCHSCQLG